MGTVLWGPKSPPTLRKALGEMIEESTKIRTFVEWKMETFHPADCKLTVGDLWNNSEPRFLLLLKGYCGTLETLQKLSETNPEAAQIFGRLSSVSVDIADIDELQRAMKTNPKVANEYLATHPEKKTVFRRIVDFLSGIGLFVAIEIIVAILNRQFRKDGGEKKENERRKAVGFDD